jgi:hypothetical protein
MQAKLKRGEAAFPTASVCPSRFCRAFRSSPPWPLRPDQALAACGRGASHPAGVHGREVAAAAFTSRLASRRPSGRRRRRRKPPGAKRVSASALRGLPTASSGKWSKRARTRARRKSSEDRERERRQAYARRWACPSHLTTAKV